MTAKAGTPKLSLKTLQPRKLGPTNNELHRREEERRTTSARQREISGVRRDLFWMWNCPRHGQRNEDFRHRRLGSIDVPLDDAADGARPAVVAVSIAVKSLMQAFAGRNQRQQDDQPGQQARNNGLEPFGPGAKRWRHPSDFSIRNANGQGFGADRG